MTDFSIMNSVAWHACYEYEIDP